ncbi:MULTISPECIES: sensor histidine kinase [unclassified Streptomyces]|uniref:sensor histidine kinase n=1 Tax=unclassified Streptomyces TaxID=2593676 RepID=UPI001CC01CCC|nr:MULTISPECIES: sensor histidine kinase [unclassified Streptomyces]WPO69823.1 sensor histidine kinase [Streptomyces sp. KN37]
MLATPRLSPLKRIPPGVWTGAAWCAAALYPLFLSPSIAAGATAAPSGALASLWGQLFLALAAVLALSGCALLVHRPWPGFALLLAGAGAFTAAWRQWEIPPPQFLSVDVALAYVAAGRPRRSSLPFAGAALAVLALCLTGRLLYGEEGGTPSEPYVALAVVIAWLVGNSVHQSRDYAEKLRAQLAAQAAGRAVAAERLRIARELHDIVAHSIGIIAFQAGAAARVVDSRPQSAREAMLAVESAGRETLSGLRRMLGSLREADLADGEGDAAGAPLAPVAGLADLDRLAETTTAAAGVRVEVRRLGEHRPLPPEIDLSAFRIIQESVTNVVRHARGADVCRVTVDYRAGDLAIEVADRGRGDGSTSGMGYGLAGMRERVALLHGEFSAAPRPGGGFLVTARLPLPSTATSGAR